jgi:hypothetical protein
MADDNSEVIGGVSVTVTGDFSQLETDLDSAVEQATAAADQIAEAFDQGDFGTDMSDSLEAIATSAEAVTEAAQTAGEALDSITGNSDLADLADDASAASDSLDEMGTAAETAGDAVDSIAGSSDLTDIEDDASAASDSLDELGTSADTAGDALDSIAASSGLADVDTDASAAVESLDQVGTAAESAGEALDSIAGSSELADLEGDASAASDSLDDLDTAAVSAGEGLEDAASGERDVSEAAEEAEGGLEGFAEQLLAVGEALAITEGLKELADEAEEASDKITTATIALTTITGSAEQAHSTIEGLEELGTNEGLAMPSLLTAATRMQQMLGPSTDVIALLGSIGNGAQAMGTDITAAAQKFDQMAVAGTASARTMSSLGLSLTGLATAINTVSGTEAANEQNAAAMFKAMDQTQRIEVLQTAMQGLGGVAAQVAQQTFGAQWTILANQWETVMVEAGQALLPVVSAMNEFLKTDIIPFIKEMATDFNALPAPIKDTAVAVTVATVALAAAALTLGTLAIPITALTTLVPAVSTAMKTLGLISGETAAAQTAEAAATTVGAAASAEAAVALGAEAVAAEGTAGAMETLGAVATETAIAETAEAAAAIANAAAHGEQAAALATEAVAAEGAAVATTGAEVATVAAGAGAVAAGSGFTLFGVALGPVAIAAAALGAVFAGLNFSGAIAQLQQLGPAIKGNSDLWNQLSANVAAAAQSISQNMVSAGTAVNNWVTTSIPGMQSLTEKIQNLTQYIPQATSVLKELGLAMSGIGLPAQQTVNALNQLGENAATMDPLITQLIKNLQATPPAISANTAAVAGFSVGLTTLIEKQTQANNLVNSTRLTMQQGAAALAAGTISQTVYNAAVVAYDNAVQAAIPHGKDFADSVAGIQLAAQKAQQTFQSSLTVYEQVLTAYENGTASAGELDEAYTKLEASAKKAGQTIADSTGILTQWNQQAAQAQTVALAAAVAFAGIAASAAANDTSITQLISDYAKWQSAAKANGDISVTTAGQVAVLTNSVLLQEGELQQNIQAWQKLNTQAQTDQAAMGGAAAAFKLVAGEASTLGVNITQVGQGFSVSAKEATPAAQQMVALLVQMMTQAGITTQTIQKGIPVYTDGATGITVYGKALTQMTGTVVDANTGIVQLNAVLPQQADAFNKAAAAANAHKTALDGVNTAAVNVDPSLFNVTTAVQNLTNAGKAQVNTLENDIAIFNDLASQSNLTVQQQVALQNAFKQVQSAASAVGVQVQVVNGQLVATASDGGTASAAMQQYLQQLNNLTSASPSAVAGQNAIAASIQKVGQAAQQAGSDIGSFAQDEAGLMGGSGFGSGGASGAAGATGTSEGLLELIAGSGALITSQQAQSAGYMLTGNNQLESISTYNAEVEQLVANLNTQFGTTGKYVEQVGAYFDQFGNKIEFAQQVLNSNYTPATQAAATATSGLTTTVTAASAAVVQYTDGMNLAAPSTTAAATAVNQFTDTVNNGSDAVGVSVDSLGNWTTTLESTGQAITTAGEPTEQAIESLGLSASTANNLMQLWESTQQGVTTSATTAAAAVSNLGTAATSASSMLAAIMTPVQTSAAEVGTLASGPFPTQQLGPNQSINPITGMVQTTPFGPAGTGGTSQVGAGLTASDLFYAQLASGQIPTSTPFPGAGTQGMSGLTAAQSALQALSLPYDIGGTQFQGALPQVPSSQQLPQTVNVSNSGNWSPNVNITVQAGTVVGQNGMQTLASMIQQQVTTTLRQTAGQKLI